MGAMIAGGRHAASALGTWLFAMLSSPDAGSDPDQAVRPRRRGLGGLYRRWLHRPGRPVLAQVRRRTATLRVPGRAEAPQPAQRAAGRHADDLRGSLHG